MNVSIYEQFIENAKARLREDGRFVALLAGGSMKEGTMDRFSDLDLVLAYDVRYRDAVMADRIGIAESLGSLLSGFTGEHVGEPRLIICLYGPPALHVDLKFVTLSELESRVENPLVLWEKESAVTQIFERTAPAWPELDIHWIEDRFWVWVHYGATKLGRGELYELIDCVSFMRRSVLGPMIATLHRRPINGVRKLEMLEGPEIEQLERTVPVHDVRSCYDALQTTINLYKNLRARFSEAKPNLAAEAVSTAYLEEVYSAYRE
ncbi:oxalate:formate antiporter [Paenibacillus arenilitoris]|uniref:Oxalate:formate antiporter n=1 Tax=Paenibacillus arenilitoris TaxID=2772299 RepID=A0A927CN02_9BACL|nr:oxalate:formate antiporter [Paenibacillus arenilitoris]MBD2870267.1 oxalate:formate antiporter [Paenibacillus arenilitoris]